MTIRQLLLIFTLLSIVSGCYSGITGRVVDAETQLPIEGAVVLVEWTKTHGFGEHWTESYKVVEEVSDKSGNVIIAGCYSPFVNPPNVTVYTKGYVAWNNEYVFPGYDRRTDFNWGSGYVFKMDKMLSLYKYIDHQSFVNGAAHPERSSEKKKIFIKSFGDAEDIKYIEELKERHKSGR